MNKPPLFYRAGRRAAGKFFFAGTLVIFLTLLSWPSSGALGAEARSILLSAETSAPAGGLVSFLNLLPRLLFPGTIREQVNPATIIIDTTRCRLFLFYGTKLVRSYPVAVGKPETPTPIGNWRIKRKAMNWGSGFGTRWLGLNVPWGIYGIHGTNKPYTIGGHESAGCIRMFNRDVEELYNLVPLGTPVVAVGPVLRGPRVLREGDCGSDVMEVQRLLKLHGYYRGVTDGVFGPGTRQAVIQFRKVHKLPPDDCVDDPVYRLLGL